MVQATNRLGSTANELIQVFEKLSKPQDIVDAFEVLQNRAKELGYPIKLHTGDVTNLVLYFHEDYDDRILVDKELSTKSDAELTSLFSDHSADIIAGSK